jgi:uncharacterized Zn finger protein
LRCLPSRTRATSSRDQFRASPARRSTRRARHPPQRPEYGWNLAHSLGLDDDRVWSDLVKAYEKLDPIAVLPVHTRLVERELADADARRYRGAARRLKKMRKLAAGSGESAQVDEFIGDLRERYRRRPRLQLELDRAGLP